MKNEDQKDEIIEEASTLLIRLAIGLRLIRDMASDPISDHCIDLKDTIGNLAVLANRYLKIADRGVDETFEEYWAEEV